MKVDFAKIFSVMLPLILIFPDWIIGGFTVSDIIMFIIFALLIIELSLFGKIIINKTFNMIILVLIILSILLFLVTSITEIKFQLSSGLIGLGKIIIYPVFIALIYPYIQKKRITDSIIKNLNRTTIVICVIGIYISIALVFKGLLPFEFFWTFTRTDESSYTYYSSQGNFIRTRSIFSEPAHLGIYLNFILSIIMFTKYNKQFSSLSKYLIIFTILLTGSYSAILLLITLFILKLINEIVKDKIKISRVLFAIPVLLSIIIATTLIFRDVFINRTLQILDGSDQSANIRLFEAWSHISFENILFGSGINQTPPITNIYAYMFSDLGLVFGLISIGFTILLLFRNIYFGMFFILFCFAKGGYLNISFWVTTMIIWLVSSKAFIKEKESKSIITKLPY